MNWYLECGNESDVIVSTRIRLARNIKGIPFKNRMTLTDKKRVLEKVKYITPRLGYGLKFFNLKDIDELTLCSLVEKNILSTEMLETENRKDRAILINEDENICIMINEEDHIRIQVFNSGLDLKNTMNLTKEIEENLDSLLGFAFNEKYGYLTSCPTNTGTGLRASVMVHLPALRITGNVSKMLYSINSLGMTVRGIYGEESKSKLDMYQISNKQTLGITENEIIANLENITRKIIEQERLARKKLTKNEIELQDMVLRAYGILSNAVKIDLQEAQELVSLVKLGTDLGLIDKLTDTKIKKIILYIKKANLQKHVGEVLNAYDRDIKRTSVIKEIINSDK